MTSSSEHGRAIAALPPAIPSIWRLCKLGYQHEPALISASVALALLAALPDALLAFWFKLIGDGAVAGEWSRVRFAALALAVSVTATWFLQTVRG
jgi:ATP-binding cassette subfamily B protein